MESILRGHYEDEVIDQKDHVKKIRIWEKDIKCNLHLNY